MVHVAVDSITQAIDCKLSVCVAFLDLCKAFDSVSCCGMLVTYQIAINVLSMKTVIHSGAW